jgi:hypothetical protein
MPLINLKTNAAKSSSPLPDDQKTRTLYRFPQLEDAIGGVAKSKKKTTTVKVHPKVQQAQESTEPRGIRTSEAPLIYGDYDYHTQMDERASAVLGVPITSKAVVPVCGEDSPFMRALSAPVPADIFKTSNVYKVDADGVYHFKPWFFIFATTVALNTYVHLYEERHGAGSFQTVKRIFMNLRRTIKNREYQRFHRKGSAE